jgi:hypothetical protein
VRQALTNVQAEIQSYSTSLLRPSQCLVEFGPIKNDYGSFVGVVRSVGDIQPEALSAASWRDKENQHLYF